MVSEKCIWEISTTHVKYPWLWEKKAVKIVYTKMSQNYEWFILRFEGSEEGLIIIMFPSLPNI